MCSVVTVSKENETKLLEQLKAGFKRTIKWNIHNKLNKLLFNLKITT